MAHPLDAVLVHEVDDQLELVQALEVGEARVIPGLDERLEAGLDELSGTATEDGLLAEEVGLGLVLEGGLDDPRAAAADPAGVGQHLVAGRAGRILVHRHQAGHTGAIDELAADQVAGALGGDHADVDAGRRLDLPEANREAVGEHQEVAVGDPVGDLVAPDPGLPFVWKQDHHDVAGAGCVRDVHHLESLPLGFGAARGVRAEPDDDLDAGVLQVERMRVAL